MGGSRKRALTDINRRFVGEWPGIRTIELHSFELLEHRSFVTYKARLQAHDRLARSNRAWKASLLALTVSTTVASVGLLSDDTMYGVAGPTTLVALSFLTLAVSLTVAERDYGARARNMFSNYRRAQQISTEAEHHHLAGTAPGQELTELSARYSALLDDSENHTTADFQAAVAPSQWTSQRRLSLAISALPYTSFAAPILTIIPFISWAADVNSR